MSDQRAAPVVPANGIGILRAALWPGLVFLVAILLAVVGLVLGIIRIAGGDASEIARLLSSANSINRLVALLLIVSAIWSLAMAEKIQGAVAVAVLGTIAGYVFGSNVTGGAP